MWKDKEVFYEMTKECSITNCNIPRTLFYRTCANVLNLINYVTQSTQASPPFSFISAWFGYQQLQWNFCIMILFALMCTWIPPSLTISEVFWNTRLPRLYVIAVVRQQFVMGTNSSIFLYRNSFGTNQRLAVTRKSFRITQVSHCGVQRV